MVPHNIMLHLTGWVLVSGLRLKFCKSFIVSVEECTQGEIVMFRELEREQTRPREDSRAQEKTEGTELA